MGWPRYHEPYVGWQSLPVGRLVISLAQKVSGGRVIVYGADIGDVGVFPTVVVDHGAMRIDLPGGADHAVPAIPMEFQNCARTIRFRGTVLSLIPESSL